MYYINDYQTVLTRLEVRPNKTIPKYSPLDYAFK